MAVDGRALLVILLLHLLVDDGMPGPRPIFRGHVILACPAPQLELFDQVDLQYTTLHTRNPFSPERRVTPPTEGGGPIVYRCARPEQGPFQTGTKTLFPKWSENFITLS